MKIGVRGEVDSVGLKQIYLFLYFVGPWLVCLGHKFYNNVLMQILYIRI